MGTVCIIGGGGFIGRAVVPLLVAAGNRVIVVGRRDVAVAPRVEYVAAPDTDALAAVLREADYVVDLAYSTTPQTSSQDPVKDMVENLTASVQRFELLLKGRSKRVVYVSSGGTVYGHAMRALIDEDHPTNPVSPYGITKLAIEKYGLLYRATNDLPFVIVRPANAYGEGQVPYRGQGFVAAAVAHSLAGRPVKVFGDSMRDYVHVEDVARAIVDVLEHGELGGVYNVGTGIGTSNGEVLEALRPILAEVGRTVAIEHLPPRAYDVKANVLSSRRLEALSGWRPRIDLATGLRRTVAWLRANAQGEPA